MTDWQICPQDGTAILWLPGEGQAGKWGHTDKTRWSSVRTAQTCRGWWGLHNPALMFDEENTNQIFVAHVSAKFTFKHVPQPLRIHTQSFGTLGQLLKIPHLCSAKYSMCRRTPSWHFFLDGILIFFYFGARPKLQKPRNKLYVRKVYTPERHPTAAHKLCLDQFGAQGSTIDDQIWWLVEEEEAYKIFSQSIFWSILWE